MEEKNKIIKKISIIGPESSGKTLLANILSRIINCKKTNEFAREYLNKKINYDFKDLDKIAVGQNNLVRPFLKKDNYFIADTSNIVTEIWSKLKFNKVSKKVAEISKSEIFDGYILCKPDIPWEFDKLRENPKNRMEIYNYYIDTLKDRKLDFIIAKGTLINRTISCLDFIKFSK